MSTDRGQWTSTLLLAARLETLKRNLTDISTSYNWREQFDVVENVWNGAWGGIWKRTQAALRRLEDLSRRAAEAPADAAAREQLWNEYAALHRESRDIFHESLEILGGLAFRNKLLDRQIGGIADELILNCATTTSTKPSLTVPASQDALRQTLGRIVRLPFPEWSIWTLPFVAYEYGHVILSELDGLKGEFDRAAKNWVDEHFAGAAPSQAERQHVAKRVASHLTDYFADAFATYTMGPAYACAAIVIRFNPVLGAFDPDSTGPCVQRACVVFGTLSKMDDGMGGYKTAVDIIQEVWKDTTASIPAVQLPAPLTERLDGLVKRVWDVFSDEFLPTVRHPLGAAGWAQALQWSTIWREELKQRRNLSLPHVDRNTQLRNVLNAAWMCRLSEPTRVNEIEDAALRLCEAILVERQKSPGGKSTKATRAAASAGPKRVSART